MTLTQKDPILVAKLALEAANVYIKNPLTGKQLPDMAKFSRKWSTYPVGNEVLEGDKKSDFCSNLPSCIAKKPTVLQHTNTVN
jgi:hypothetical protein